MKRLHMRRLAKRLDKMAVADWLAAPLHLFDPFNTAFAALEGAQYYEARRVVDDPRPVDEVTVMSWNIKFGGGRIDFWYDGHGRRVLMEAWEVVAHLEGLAAKIRQVDPHILLLQEVDVDSKRVAFIDQMQWLLDHTDLNYGVYASQWRADHVPSQGLGRVDMGVAILSTYPIRAAQRLALPHMTTQDGLTRYFYLKRGLLTACVDIPNCPPLHVVNIHTEPFATDGTKRRHLEYFFGELDRIDKADAQFVAGGDLNTLPPGTDKRHDFDDVVNDDEDFQGSDYRGQESWLRPFYEAFQPAVPLAEYQRDNGPFFTHSTTAKVFWNRKLDYLFTNRNFAPDSAITHQDESTGGIKTMLLSDHAPVSARLKLSQQVHRNRSS